MEVALSSDQELLRSTTRSFLDAHCPLTATRALADDPLGYDPDVWRQGAALGFTSLLVSEQHGGGSLSGDGIVDAAIVAYEFGRLVAPGPLVATNVVADALSRFGGGEDALEALIDGSACATWTPVAPGGIPTVQAHHEVDGDVWVLDGGVSAVEYSVGATWILVSACDDHGVTQLLVPADSPGVTVTPLGGLDLVRRFAEVRFDGVRVNSALVVGAAGEAQRAVLHQLAVAVALSCAETVGALEEMFARTLTYLADRYSFGRPLNSYQALKHRCADDALAIQRCAATADAATRAVSNDTDDADELVSIAKAFIGPVATEVLQDCVQLHGGIGVTWEHDLHLYLRRVTTNRMIYGTPDEHLDRVATNALGPVQ